MSFIEAAIATAQGGPGPTRPSGVLVAVQVTLLLLVAAGATAVVLTRNQTRQVILLSIYGVLLAVLFLVFQAPDVTLSELTVGAVLLPLMILLTLAKTRGTSGPDTPQRDRHQGGGSDSGGDQR
jgi:uncharacterized MnhB-related membrane protein